MSDQTQEMRVRRMAARAGYSVHKARGGQHQNNHGAFMLVEQARNMVVLGADFDASLDDIAARLKADQ
jgi:hypothetical protein